MLSATESLSLPAYLDTVLRSVSPAFSGGEESRSLGSQRLRLRAAPEELLSQIRRTPTATERPFFPEGRGILGFGARSSAHVRLHYRLARGTGGGRCVAPHLAAASSSSGRGSTWRRMLLNLSPLRYNSIR